MRMQSSTSHLLGTASVLALSAAALLASSAATPAAAAQISAGIYAGGSTLASQAFRQIFDCYAGTTVGNDGFSFSSSFSTSPPTPGLLPSTCTSAPIAVQGMYAGVGSGNGFRGYISNQPVEWYGGTVATTSGVISTPFPSSPPPFVDSNNSNFGTYPYPRVDIGLSDSPLAGALPLNTVAFAFTPSTNWSTAGGSITQVTVGTAAPTVTYSTGSWGNPIQLPAFEVPVAIPINVNSTSFQINSQIKSSGVIVQGGAIQLTEGQLCAIFSGLVTNWNDTTTTIPYLTNAATPTTTGLFDYANVGNGVSVPQAYANASLPITVVYRGDGSGTSFIITNYLHNVCPLLDPNNTYGYKSIFGASNLPSTTFANLVNNIVSFRGNGPWNATTGAHWLAETGSGGVAATISDSSANAGYIGYVSADFTNPYAKTVSGAGLTNVDAPRSSALQNENLRIAGTNVPSTSSTTLTFIAPTPTSANNAWADTALTAPSTTSTWSAWNVYGIAYGATTHGNVTVTGLSVLPLTNHAGAYPLAGTTFMALYSCYGNATNGQNVINFLNWFYQNSGSDPDVKAVLNNNGFAPLTTTWQARLQNGYLTPGSGIAIALISGGSTDGCTGVTGGANP